LKKRIVEEAALRDAVDHCALEAEFPDSALEFYG
jgi:hypothetical protein